MRGWDCVLWSGSLAFETGPLFLEDKATQLLKLFDLALSIAHFLLSLLWYGRRDPDATATWDQARQPITENGLKGGWDAVLPELGLAALPVLQQLGIRQFPLLRVQWKSALLVAGCSATSPLHYVMRVGDVHLAEGWPIQAWIFLLIVRHVMIPMLQLGRHV